MIPAGFKPAVPASERPKTLAFRPLGHWDSICAFSWSNNNNNDDDDNGDDDDDDDDLLYGTRITLNSEKH